MMNRSAQFKEDTFSEYVLPDGRTVTFFLLTTERAIQLSLWPLYFAESSEIEGSSPEELEIRWLDLLEKARQLIISQSYEPKFVQGKAVSPDEISIDIFRKDIDDSNLLQFYTEILNASSVRVKRTAKSLEELSGRETLVLACEAFGLNPLEVKKWDVGDSSELVECFDILIEAKKKAQRK